MTIAELMILKIDEECSEEKKDYLSFCGMLSKKAIDEDHRKEESKYVFRDGSVLIVTWLYCGVGFRDCWCLEEHDNEHCEVI